MLVVYVAVPAKLQNRTQPMKKIIPILLLLAACRSNNVPDRWLPIQSNQTTIHYLDQQSPNYPGQMDHQTYHLWIKTGLSTPLMMSTGVVDTMIDEVLIDCGRLAVRIVETVNYHEGVLVGTIQGTEEFYRPTPSQDGKGEDKGTQGQMLLQKVCAEVE